MRVCDAWNRELRRRTGSALQLRFYSNGVQGDEDEVVRKIRQGRIDGGMLTAIGLAQIHRPTVAFQIPGLFQTYEQLDHARDALRPELDAAFQQRSWLRECLGGATWAPSRIFGTRGNSHPGGLRSHAAVRVEHRPSLSCVHRADWRERRSDGPAGRVDQSVLAPGRQHRGKPALRGVAPVGAVSDPHD